MSNSRITHPSSGSITPEQARDLRAKVWHFIFDCYCRKQKAAETSGGEDAKKEKK